jgi:hypothetical protein
LQLSQSMATARYAARLAGLAGRNEAEHALADMAAEFAHEFETGRLRVS